MATATITPLRPTEVWMVLTNLRRLKLLMAYRDTSGRQLAEIAGYRSHTYMQRLLRGEVKTLKAEPALRIANHFKVPMDDLFMIGASMNTGADHQDLGRPAA
jgi:transcriptional regulator with XRE-family HTH domain